MKKKKLNFDVPIHSIYKKFQERSNNYFLNFLVKNIFETGFGFFFNIIFKGTLDVILFYFLY
jgi:hypothetical protein